MSSELNKELSEFGLSALDLEAIFKIALRKGGALAELFFEETIATRIFFEGGKIDRIMDGTDRGVGFRIIFDHRSVYGYTTELTQESLEKLAGALSEAVTAKDSKPWSKKISWGLARQPVSEIAAYDIVRSPERRQSAKKSKSRRAWTAEPGRNFPKPGKSRQSCSIRFARSSSSTATA